MQNDFHRSSVAGLAPASLYLTMDIADNRLVTDHDDDDGKISWVDNSPSSALAMVSMQLVKSAVKISGVVSFWKDVAMEFSFHIR